MVNAWAHKTTLACLAATLFLGTPLAAGAQYVPSYATPVARQESIKGILTGFNGAYIVYMRDDRGYDDHVTMHDGTVINPTGIKLVEGMRVTIYGYTNGSTFGANRIDVSPPDYGGNPYYSNPYGDSYGGSPYGYGGSPYGYGNSYGGWGPWWGVGVGWWGGWPGWGWGNGFFGAPCCFRGPGFRGPFPGQFRGGVHGTISAPPRGGVQGGGGSHGSVHGPPRP